MPLVVIEMMIASLGVSVWLCKKYAWDWIIGIVLFFSIIFLLGVLFFRIRIFRYIISILFSLFWALLAYSFATGLTKSHVSPWLLAGFVFIVGILLHKGYYKLEREATRVEYRER